MTEKLKVKNLVKEYEGEQVLKGRGISQCPRPQRLRQNNSAENPHRSGIPDSRGNTAGRKRYQQAPRLPKRYGHHLSKLCFVPQYDSSGKRRVCPEDQT